MIILDVIMMAAITAAIVGLLVWSICTQHRHYGSEHLRIRRRLHISVSWVIDDVPALRSGSMITPRN